MAALVKPAINNSMSATAVDGLERIKTNSHWTSSFLAFYGISSEIT